MPGAGFIRRMIARLKQGWIGLGAEKFVVLAGAALFCVAVWVVVELADDAVAGDYLELEGRILRTFRHPDDLARGLGPAWVTSVVRDITALGSVAVLTLLVVLVPGFLLLLRRYRAAVLILLATVGGTIVSSLIKVMAGRERPDVVPHLMEATSASFPSGHSMMSSVVYLTLGALLGQTMARKREKIYLFCAALLLTMLVGLSRVYLGVHYPTDVAAGWAAGTAWALMCWGIAWGLQRRGKLAGPGAAVAAGSRRLETAPGIQEPHRARAGREEERPGQGRREKN